MHPISLQRRQLLFYLGLGMVGAGVTTACGAIPQGPGTGESIAAAPAIAPSAQDSAAADVAARPAGSQALPEFQGIQQWLNSSPLSVADLKGNVVLVQIWTFACINCQRTLPYITRWHQQYAAQGLKVVGVHTPEFGFERDVSNIKQAVQKHNIQYPVAIDNEFKTWKAYKNEYWPHLFLADRQGFLRYDHIGEGAYDTTEQTIRQLLG
jgi:thiol-disulfide isomerase/thioredoxin